MRLSGALENGGPELLLPVQLPVQTAFRAGVIFRAGLNGTGPAAGARGRGLASLVHNLTVSCFLKEPFDFPLICFSFSK